MTLRYVAEIRDPVHGYIKITEEERAIIDSPFIQRLRRIHQLAGAYMVYPGGVHSRFEHVLGTMHVAGLIGESIADKVDLGEEQIAAATAEIKRLADSATLADEQVDELLLSWPNPAA